MKNVNIINKKIFIVLVSAFFYLSWVLGFLTSEKILVENISLLVVGIAVLLFLVFTKDINNILIFILFVPFMFARPLDPMTIPIMIYVACGCLAVGLIIHYIKNKPKFKCGTLLYGLSFLGLGMICGGINIASDFLLYQICIMLFVVGMFLIVYVYLISTSKKIDFNQIAFLMTILGVYIALQTITFFISSDDFIKELSQKSLSVGWGISNNIALMFLVTIPFTFYLFSKSNLKTSIIYFILLVLQAGTCVLTHSRGGLLALVVEVILMLGIYLVRFKKDKVNIKKFIIYSVITLSTASLILLLLYKFKYDSFLALIEPLKRLDFGTLNGRVQIYEEALIGMKDHLLFGKGVLFSMFTVEGEEVMYVWGHSTILQTFSTMGIFGTIGLLYHLFEKYFVLLKKTNFEKLMIFISLFGSGLYGLFDVSYYFINYMVVLVIIFVLCEPYFYNCKIENFTKKINNEKVLDK